MFICKCDKKSNNYLDSMHINCSNCNNTFHSECAGISKLKQAQLYCKTYDFICNDCRHNILYSKFFPEHSPEIKAYHELKSTFGNKWIHEFERKSTIINNH